MEKEKKGKIKKKGLYNMPTILPTFFPKEIEKFHNIDEFIPILPILVTTDIFQ